MTRRRHHTSQKHRKIRYSHRQYHPWYSLKRSWGRALLIVALMALVLLLSWLLPTVFTGKISFFLLTALGAAGICIVWKKWMKIVFGLLTLGFGLMFLDPMLIIYAIIFLIGGGIILTIFLIRLLIVFCYSFAGGAGFGAGLLTSWNIIGNFKKKR